MVDATVFTSDQEGEDASPGPGGSLKEGTLGRLQRQVTRFVRRLRPDGEDLSAADWLRDHAEGERPLDETERSMLLNLLKFRSVRVDDVMVPRANITAVEVSTPFADLVDLFREAGHSRLPVYQKTLDDPLGMVHIKDILACFATPQVEDGETGGIPSDPMANWPRLKKGVLFVPPSMPAADLLVQMQAARIHMALVIDEYGGTEGLVTIEDLVETIVGDIEDEHDTEEEREFVALESGGFQVDAGFEIEDFEELTSFDLAYGEDETEEVDTLGGLVFTLAGRVPCRGEIIRHPGGYDLEIIEADPRRIRRLRVVPRPDRSQERSEGEEI